MCLGIFSQLCLLHLLLILKTISSEDSSEGKEEEFLHYAEKLRARETAGFNESCHFEDDEKRTEIGIKISQLVISPTEELMEEIIDNIKEVLKSRYNFCPERLSLACDKNTQQCQCGPLAKGIIYVMENGLCRLDKGSLCGNIDMVNTLFNASCSSKSKCRIRENGFQCENENVEKQFKKTGKMPDCYCEKDSETEKYPMTAVANVNYFPTDGKISVLFLFIFVSTFAI